MDLQLHLPRHYTQLCGISCPGGAILLTILLVFGFVNDTLGVARGILPAMRLPVSLIETFAGVTAAIFLYVFYRDQH